MNCPRCSSAVPPDATFCPKCGLRLVLTCSQCQTTNDPGDAYCKRCGSALEAASTEQDQRARFSPVHAQTPRHLSERIIASKAALEGERKRVTVLFADLKGSMELLADRDPEEARRLLDAVIERMIEAVHRYEGTVNQVMGDGIMALFGAPLAHEDHATRACYAALRMQDAVARYAQDLRGAHGIEPQIRVGLNSGEVVVRSIGSDLRMDYTAIGQTTHLAARMEQLARPGTTLVTEATLHEAEGYVQVRPLGPVPIKGMNASLPVYEVIGAGDVRTRLQASAARGLTRFVGREAEVEQLREAVEQAASGHGQIVAVVGEPGVGKSRLLYEFIHSERPRGWLVLQSDSVPYGKPIPYLPVAQLLRDYFRLNGQDDAPAVAGKVANVVSSLGEALEDAVAPLLWLLDSLAEDHEFLAMDPSTRRECATHAVKQLLMRESIRQPLLLVLEDLQWIDAESQSLLDALAESLPAARILLTTTCRPEYQHPWSSKTYYRQLRVDPLPPATARALLEPLIGAGPSLDALGSLLIERTEGNPFFLEESVRSLVETDVLIGERGAYCLGKDPAVIHVPATVQAILAARIDRLAPGDKRLLRIASVIGKDVPWALLLDVSDVPEPELRGSLARLQSAELLYEARVFPCVEYTFKHALTHEVAYASLLQDQRRVLHARIVEGIERLYADRLADQVDRLAHHVFRGEVWHKALRYLRQTGSPGSQQAIDALNICLGGTESYGHLCWWRGEHGRAVALARREMALSANFRNFELGIASTFRLGQALHSLGEYSQAAEVLERNVKLLEGDLRRERFRLSALPSVFSQAWLVLCLMERGRFQEASVHAAEAAATAQAENHALSLAISQITTGLLLGRQRDYAGAVGFLERALAIGRASDMPVLLPVAGAPLGWVYAKAGRHGEGVRLLQDAVQRAEGMGLAAHHALRLVWLAEALDLAGNRDAAMRIARRALELAREHAEHGHEAFALRLLGDLTTDHADPGALPAAGHYRAGLALARKLGMQALLETFPSFLP
jgi:class 3 adenylate cyclase/tetratricopeptide (TPR) repeat protein